MALKTDFKYYWTRLNFIKIVWIHLTTWITVIVLSLLIIPFYTFGAPWAASVYTEFFSNQDRVVVPKVIAAEDYQVGDTRVIDLVNGQKILYVTISNKANPDVGWFPWVYSYQVLAENGEVLEQRTRQNQFLLPGEETFIIVYTNNERAESLRIQPNNIDSRLVPHNRDSPNFLQQPDVSLRSVEITENENGNSYRVLLLFSNNDRLDVNQMDFTYILRDRAGKIVGINSSVIAGFLAGTERGFVENDQPKPQRALERTPVLEGIIRINYLDPEIVELT